jgi:O-antigen ligase
MNQSPQPQQPYRLSTVFAVFFGVFLGLSLLKFGNPCILEKLIDRPASIFEWLLNAWPVVTGYWLLGGFAILGLLLFPQGGRPPRGLLVLPLIWLAWQFVSATHSVDAGLTGASLRHFAACITCFFIGCFVLPQAKPELFLAGLLAGLVAVIIVGWEQHFGGLAGSRKYFFAYIYPQMKTVPPELLKKMSSDRIFSTLFYPNTLAGVLLLLLPPSLATIGLQRERLTAGARFLLVGLLGLGALGCLYWSGSKAGWLLMLVLGLAALLRMRSTQRTKLILVGAILVVGLAGFALRFAGYFQKGATSAAARGDYWRAAAQTALANPVFGTGPGTFAIPYKKIKKPGSEMARLVHNDYLQQASDSGLVGAAAYLAFIAGTLWAGWRKLARRNDWLMFSVWLGLLGWSLQSLVEFGLYIPAVAWPAFALMGWLLATGNEFDKKPANP